MTTKIYRRVYDNPYDNYGTQKPNKFLGEFDIIKVLEDDLYNSISNGIKGFVVSPARLNPKGFNTYKQVS